MLTCLFAHDVFLPILTGVQRGVVPLSKLAAFNHSLESTTWTSPAFAVVR